MARAPRPQILIFFFFNDTATTELYTLSLHDALPICDRDARRARGLPGRGRPGHRGGDERRARLRRLPHPPGGAAGRSEEHTSELQSRRDLVCRLLLEKKKQNIVDICLSLVAFFAYPI